MSRLYTPGTREGDMEDMILAGLRNFDISEKFGYQEMILPAPLARIAAEIRNFHNLATAGRPRKIDPRKHQQEAVYVPVAEIRRLSQDRRLPLTQIAALLRVPYRAVTEALASF